VIVATVAVVVMLLASTAFALTPIDEKRNSLPWLGSPLIPEKVAPDGVGHYRHYEHGSIYWKPSTGPHEVHGLIRKLWANLNWEKGPLGYPLTDERPTQQGSANRFNDFENGVIWWKSGSAAATELSPNVLASKKAADMQSIFTAKVKSILPASVDGHAVYLKWLCLCGPEPLNTLNNLLTPVTDYRFAGGNVNGNFGNRLYKVRFQFGISAGTDDPTVTVDLRIKVFKSGNNIVTQLYPSWWRSVHVTWPTSIFVDASEIGAKVDAVVQPLLGTILSTTPVPVFNVLSVKVMPNGDLNTYTAS